MKKAKRARACLVLSHFDPLDVYVQVSRRLLLPTFDLNAASSAAFPSSVEYKAANDFLFLSKFKIDCCGAANSKLKNDST
jgi:hypothetical protein